MPTNIKFETEIGPSTGRSERLCPKCSAVLRAGTSICRACQTSLNSSDPVPETKHLPPLVVKDDALKITVLFEIDGQLFCLPSQHNLIIGRTATDGSMSRVPDLDLSPYGAYEKGVSRHHLKLCRDSAVYVNDLGSANGTFINGQRLMPNIDYPLHHGDELRAGRLKIKVKFQYH
jgi:hypothetical protein